VSHTVTVIAVFVRYVPRDKQQLNIEDIVKEQKSVLPVRYDLRMKKQLSTETPKL
jgi:septum formation topological specificity factor MinE